MPASGGFSFGPFRLDAEGKRLLRGDEPVALGHRQLALLRKLVTDAPNVVFRDDLVIAAWQDVIVGENSLEQEIRKLRLFLDPEHPFRYIETVKRVGYRFVEPVTPIAWRGTDADIDAGMAPQRAAIEARAALETLQLNRVAEARAVAQQLVNQHADDPNLLVALANACLEQYEATRADARPDVAVLHLAERHARQALHLDMKNAHAWATLGQILGRAGDYTGAIAALRKAIELEPDECTHYLRLAWIAWGGTRLSAARRLLELMPGMAAAHWLVASVFVARNSLAEAKREVDSAVAALSTTTRANGAAGAFPTIAVHLLDGLLLLAHERRKDVNRGEAEGPRAVEAAMKAFASELAIGTAGHIYGRETEANTWYAIGACEHLCGNRAAADHAFAEARARIPTHAMARAGEELLTGKPGFLEMDVNPASLSVDEAMGRAAVMKAGGDTAGGARLVAEALRAAPPGNAGWTIPIDPLLDVQRDPEVWAEVLALLRDRAR